jgi:class 3 adenylate cyclase
LEANGLGKYSGLFAENDIDFDVLPELSESDLNELGLPVGARRRLVIAIRNLNRTGRDGRPVEATSTVTGERGQATVLFSDLSGYARTVGNSD